MIKVVKENISIVLSIVAVVATIHSNIIAEEAKTISNDAHRLAVYKQRTELLKEIDKQQALLNRLATITVKKISDLSGSNKKGLEGEINRLKNNYDAINGLRGRYEEQRELAYKMNGTTSQDALELAIVDVRRLTLHLEQDINNELMAVSH